MLEWRGLRPAAAIGFQIGRGDGGGLAGWAGLGKIDGSAAASTGSVVHIPRLHKIEDAQYQQFSKEGRNNPRTYPTSSGRPEPHLPLPTE